MLYIYQTFPRVLIVHGLLIINQYQRLKQASLRIC